MTDTRNVRDFGARGDGVTLDTAAFQAALDACGRAGGGTVVCPPGKYRLRKVLLPDNCTLRLERESTLLNAVERIPEPGREGYANRDNFLLGAIGARRVAIVGPGRIDGCGEDYWVRGRNISFAYERPHFDRLPDRPKSLLHFRFCAGVRLEGVAIVNSPAYAVWTVGCDDVAIGNVSVDNDPGAPNSDALDMDCCRRVRISGCRISAGDDALAIKSGTDFAGEGRSCENVVVSDCILRSTKCAIRLGFEGDGDIRNCRFANVVIRESRTGISLQVVRLTSNPALRVEHGSRIEDIEFRDMEIDAAQALLFAVEEWDPGPMRGYIRRVRMCDIVARATRGCVIAGRPANRIEDVRLERLRLALSGAMGDTAQWEPPDPYPLNGAWDTPGVPYAFVAQHTDGLSFRDVQVDRHATTGWGNPLRIRDARRLDAAGLTVVP